MHEITLEYLLTHHFEKTGLEYYSDSDDSFRIGVC